MPRKRKALRREGGFQNSAAVGDDLEAQHIPQKHEFSQKIRKVVRRDPAIDDRPIHRQFSQRQQAGKARAAQRTAIRRVQPGDSALFQMRQYLVHRLFYGGKIAGVFRLMSIVNHLKDAPVPRKQAHTSLKRPHRLRRAGKKQQDSFVFLSALDDLHGVSLLFRELHTRRIIHDLYKPQVTLG